MLQHFAIATGFRLFSRDQRASWKRACFAMEHGDEEAQLLFQGRRVAASQPSASWLAKKDRVQKFKTCGVTK